MSCCAGARALPAPGSETYEQTTRAFYHGLAALEVGLLDDARQQFTQRHELVPRGAGVVGQPGLAQLRLGELRRPPRRSNGRCRWRPTTATSCCSPARMETARGRLDEGIARLRRAVALDPRGLRARFALAEELTRLASADADAEAQTLLDELAQRAPANLAVHAGAGAAGGRRRDAQRLRESVQR